MSNNHFFQSNTCIEMEREVRDSEPQSKFASVFGYAGRDRGLCWLSWRLTYTVYSYIL